MASIFTYDPDPPRVASPWLCGGAADGDENANVRGFANGSSLSGQSVKASSHFTSRESNRLTHLQPEPQEGPVEYKLHLLLRPRRKFKATSTGAHISGSRHSKSANNESTPSLPESFGESSIISDAAALPSASTQQTRQHRLEQLTTQLLWRLQQSSPYHSSSATNIILPSLPEALPELQAPQGPAKLLHGLEESRGALYEIGVSDDGTLVGLAEDEMQESLNNLRAMAACLGCTVETLRKEVVGEGEWLEDVAVNGKAREVCRAGRLVVVEALVKPHLQVNSPALPSSEIAQTNSSGAQIDRNGVLTTHSTEQLRITLTGPTMSGKSSLLGTLTTSTLDNGRGKSRISMLKHRHEISSGVTSSVTQELLGYADTNDGSVEVINYATENIASWIDLHVAAAGSRLVFISDSAGHPRYRRTTLRGLVGWAPHWTLLCIPADDTELASSKAGSTDGTQQNVVSAVSDMDLSGAQLDLCLRLRLPLVVIITKLDVASRAGLKDSLSKVLDALKAAGRRPAILANTPGDVSEDDLQFVGANLIDDAYNIALPLLNDETQTVPIVLTSAVQGTGISNLHALLHELPMPNPFPSPTNNLGVVFHIEDVYSKPAEAEAVIVSGRLRAGQISVGDIVTLGPFSAQHLEDSEDSDERSSRKAPPSLPTSRSFPGALRNAHLSLPPRFQLPNQEWRRFKAASIRNLRFPTHSLLPDQVGTIAIVPDYAEGKATPSAGFAGIRKGMVLTSVQPIAARSFVAEFHREDLKSLAVGNHVVVYIASVRASARVLSAKAPDSPIMADKHARRESDGHDPFELEDLEIGRAEIESNIESPQKVAGTVTARNLLVTFSFDSSKEFVIVGDQVLVMPGGGPGLYGGHGRGEKGLAGLEGFVGRVTEMYA